jgi:2'-5' RNA ligase
VIFIDVVPSDALQALQSALEQYMLIQTGISIKAYSAYHPHITIGRKDIPKQLYTTAEQEYKRKIFQTTFPCNEISLLKHNGARWEINKVFFLNPH